jgi:hypothetical protein
VRVNEKFFIGNLNPEKILISYKNSNIARAYLANVKTSKKIYITMTMKKTLPASIKFKETDDWYPPEEVSFNENPIRSNYSISFSYSLRANIFDIGLLVLFSIDHPRFKIHSQFFFQNSDKESLSNYLKLASKDIPADFFITIEQMLSDKRADRPSINQIFQRLRSIKGKMLNESIEDTFNQSKKLMAR